MINVLSLFRQEELVKRAVYLARVAKHVNWPFDNDPYLIRFICFIRPIWFTHERFPVEMGDVNDCCCRNIRMRLKCFASLIYQPGVAAWSVILSIYDRIKYCVYYSSIWLHTTLYITVILRECIMLAITAAIIRYRLKFFTRQRIYSSANEAKQRISSCRAFSKIQSVYYPLICSFTLRNQFGGIKKILVLTRTREFLVDPIKKFSPKWSSLLHQSRICLANQNICLPASKQRFYLIQTKRLLSDNRFSFYWKSVNTHWSLLFLLIQLEIHWLHGKKKRLIELTMKNERKFHGWSYWISVQVNHILINQTRFLDFRLFNLNNCKF